MTHSFKRISLLVLTVALASEQAVHALFPINILRPYETYVVPPRVDNSTFQVGMIGGAGFHAYGRDDSSSVNVLQIWQPDLSTLTMLRGFPAGSPQNELLQNININVDDGIRGHMVPMANFHLGFEGIFTLAAALPHNFMFGVYVPFYAMSLSEVCWKDLTLDVNNEDLRTRELITNKDLFRQRILALGGPDVAGNWSRVGFGDVVAQFDWHDRFPQRRPAIREVFMRAHGGLSLPTGLKTNPDQLMSVAFGNDGSAALVFGGGLAVNLYNTLDLGFDADLMYTFGNTALRRIRTAVGQSDLVLLQKACAYRDFGFTQQFNLFARLTTPCRDWMARATYQFIRHGDDRLTVVDNCYSTIIADTAVSLEEWVIHDMIFDVTYTPPAFPGKPSVSLFYKVPFKGKRAILTQQIGLSFSFNF